MFYVSLVSISFPHFAIDLKTQSSFEVVTLSTNFSKGVDVCLPFSVKCTYQCVEMQSDLSTLNSSSGCEQCVCVCVCVRTIQVSYIVEKASSTEALDKLKCKTENEGGYL